MFYSLTLAFSAVDVVVTAAETKKKNYEEARS